MDNAGKNHYARKIPCRVCGSLVETTAPSTTCDECREIRRQETDRAKYRPSFDPRGYVVLEDPDEIGGFRKGAVINREQVRYMLLPSIRGFTVGTLLRNKQGDLFTILNGENRCLKMKPM
jgi:hypothetical protein